jgi:hypothetical protein
MGQYSSWRIQQDMRINFHAFERIENSLGVDVIFQNYLLMEYDTGSHQGYDMTGWRKAFRIADGQHLKTRLTGSQMSANFGILG